MDPNALSGMIFTLLLAMLIGGFILLFPLTRRLGALLEARLKEGKEVTEGPPSLTSAEMEALHAAIERLGDEVQRLTDRQDFMERLLSQRMDPRPLGAPEASRLPGTSSEGPPR